MDAAPAAGPAAPDPGNALLRALGWGAAVAGAALAPALAVIASGRTIVWRDSGTLYDPVRPLVAAALRDLELPLWNPHEAFGVPLLAQMLHGVLHPVSLACAWLAPSTGVEPMLLLHVAAAALGAGVLARALGAAPAAAAAAGLAYGLSGWVLGMTSNLLYLASAATAPWAVAGLRWAGLRGTAGTAVAATGVAVLHLAGDPQWTAIAVLLGAALAAEGGGLRGLGRAAAGVAIGTALGAVQLAPAWAFLGHTVRAAGLDAADRAQWALAPARLVELVAPGFFAGRPGVDSPAPVFLWLGGATQSRLSIPFAPSVFVGAPVLALAAAGVRASRAGRVLGGAALVLLWLALGVHAGAEQALRWVPIWSDFRYAEKLAGPLTLCLAVLAGLGAGALADRPSRAFGRSCLAAAAAAALVALVLLALPAPHAPALGTDAATLEQARAALGLGLLSPAATMAALGGLLALARRGVARPLPLLAAALVFAQSAAASPFALRAGRRDVRAAPLVPADRAGPFTRYATPLETPPFPNPLRLDSADLEIAVRSRLGTAPFNVPGGLDQAGTYTGLPPRSLGALAGRFGPDLWVALRRYGITHVVLRAPAGEAEAMEAGAAVDRGTLVREDGAWGLSAWRVPHRPWASFAGGATPAAGDEAALDALVAIDLAGLPSVVVQGGAPPAGGRGRVLSAERRREWLRVEAESDGDGLLVVNEAFWPGWRAALDGREVEILKADALVRAVVWPAGRHVLEMRYDPPEVRAGLLASALGLVALAAAAGAAIARRRRGSPSLTSPSRRPGPGC